MKHDTKWICSKHGEVKPKGQTYSMPAYGSCPNCGEDLESGVIKVLSGADAVLMRPNYYTWSHINKLAKDDPKSFTSEVMKEIRKLKSGDKNAK